MNIIIFLAYWTIANIVAILLQLFFKSPADLKKNLKNMQFPDSHFMTFLGYLCMYVLFPLTIPVSLYYIYQQIKRTFF